MRQERLDEISTDTGLRFVVSLTLRKTARALTERLRASNSVDWCVRESVRAKLRLMVKAILKKYKYLPDGQERATETALERRRNYRRPGRHTENFVGELWGPPEESDGNRQDSAFRRSIAIVFQMLV
jgi:hypothetical protein